MVTATLVPTMRVQSDTDVVETFMASTIQNFTNISKMTRRRYRTIIPSTTRKFKRLEDKSSLLDGVQNTQSPQDLLTSKPPRSNTTPVHLRSLEDFETAVMEFMQEPLVSLAKPSRLTRRRPLKRMEEKENTEYPVSNLHLDDRLCTKIEENVVSKQVSPIRDQTVPSTGHKTEELLQKTHVFSNTSERKSADFFNRNYNKTVDVPITFKSKSG